MGNKRISFTDNQSMVLYNEVDGHCPFCDEKLCYEKNGNIYKSFEIAHIYPLNPSKSEIELLKNEERLSSGVNDLNNVIAVCKKCHSKFDSPRTIEEYREWISVKKKILENSKIKDEYCRYDIEEDIKNVLNKLNTHSVSKELKKLNYKSLKIDDKLNDTCSFLLKREIKNDVVDYFLYIRGLFKELNKYTPYKFEIIASQIRTTYFKIKQTNDNQDVIYYSLVNWLYKKTGSKYRKACEIIIAFFIQDCEVFE